LLFYTDGITVWNKQHDVLQGGVGLMGDPSSTQSGIIVPRPQSTTLYYIFSVAAQANPNGLTYSEVDMTLDGGLGGITGVYNEPLLTPTCEKVTAVLHSNGTDIWVISHKWNSNEFYTYLVTDAGLDTTPVISAIGTSISGVSDNTIGYLKASPSGTKIALAHWTYDEVQVFDFNSTTGELSNEMTIGENYGGYGPYGLEFSAGSQYLYVATHLLSNPNSSTIISELHQYDLLSADPPSSGQIVGESASSIWFGALQLAINGKIYINDVGTDHLSVIHNPEQAGAGCNFEYNAQDLVTGTQGVYGLPPFIQSYFIDANFQYTGICLGDTTEFQASVDTYDALQWNFGDPDSGPLNTSDLPDPVHYYDSPGIYDVELTVYYDGDSSSSSTTVQIISFEVDLGNDTTICEGSSLLIDATTPSASYLWNTEATSSTIQVSDAGAYFVEVNIQGCLEYDTLLLAVSPIPPVDLGLDSIICEGQSVVLDATLANATYQWQNNSTSATFTASVQGTYTVNVTVDGCTGTDSFDLDVIPLPPLDLGPDRTICEGTNVALDVTVPGATYLWHDQSSGPVYNATETGTYSVVLTLQFCETGDDVFLDFVPIPQAYFPTDTLICLGANFNLVAINPNATYLWNDDSTNATLLVDTAGTYSVEISVGECVADYVIDVSTEVCDVIMTFPNVFSPGGDTWNGFFQPINFKGIHSAELLIYNRWGNLIFTQTGARPLWDGYTKGGDYSPEGVYYWICNYEDFLGGHHKLSGNVSLLRK
jgi:gliding motility-associated-like protein